MRMRVEKEEKKQVNGQRVSEPHMNINTQCVEMGNLGRERTPECRSIEVK